MSKKDGYPRRYLNNCKNLDFIFQAAPDAMHIQWLRAMACVFSSCHSRHSLSGIHLAVSSEGEAKNLDPR